MNKLLKIIVALIVSLFFVSCTSPSLDLDAVFPTKKIDKKPVIAANLFSMPRDAYRVVLAIGSKIIDNKKASKNVVLESSYKTDLKEAKLFSFNNAILTSYDNINSNYKSLTADIFFTDPLYRQVAYTINAQYSIENRKIVVKSYTISPKYSQSNNTVGFILPAEKYKKIFSKRKDVLKNFYTFYKYISLNAIKTEEAKNYTDKKEWAIVVFFMNRVSKSATVKLGISNKKNKYDIGYKKDTKYIIIDGWRIATTVGKFQLLSYTKNIHLYAKAFVTPGDEYTGSFFTKSEKLVGVYMIK